jgi:hypothetical protein
MTALFRRLSPPAPGVDVIVNGRAVKLPEGEPLAAALLAEGIHGFGVSPLIGAPRGPLCLMGSCFQCAATVDGVKGQRICRMTVRAGMRLDLPGEGLLGPREEEP